MAPKPKLSKLAPNGVKKTLTKKPSAFVLSDCESMTLDEKMSMARSKHFDDNQVEKVLTQADYKKCRS